jgi:hypothetical protein
MSGEICISLLDTGCGFWGKMEPIMAKVEIGENPCKHRRNSVWRNGAKGRLRITKPLLYH